MASNSGFLLANSWLFFPVGVYIALRITISIVFSLIYFWNTHVKIAFSPKVNLKQKYGQWAVVTGCTSGIGEQFVHELASLGMDVILISRSMDKLKLLAQQTERQYGVKTKIIACNYLEKDAYKEVLKQTEGMSIGFLVNNVGLNTDTGSRRYDEMTVEAIRDMVVVNSGAATLMTKVFLPGMISRSKGCVLNIGSTSGYIPLPFQALYCGTKAYLRSWSRAADEEIKGSQVLVRCNVPQFVRTNMCKGNNFIYNFPIWTCEPRAYAQSSIRTINTPDTGGYIVYDFMLWFTKMVTALLRTDMRTPLIYQIMCLILPHCSRVEN